MRLDLTSTKILVKPLNFKETSNFKTNIYYIYANISSPHLLLQWLKMNWGVSELMSSPLPVYLAATCSSHQKVDYPWPSWT